MNRKSRICHGCGRPMVAYSAQKDTAQSEAKLSRGAEGKIPDDYEELMEIMRRETEKQFSKDIDWDAEWGDQSEAD